MKNFEKSDHAQCEFTTRYLYEATEQICRTFQTYYTSSVFEIVFIRGIFDIQHVSELAVGPTQPPNQWMWDAIFHGGEMAGTRC
jgi:hypothetical protein